MTSLDDRTPPLVAIGGPAQAHPPRARTRHRWALGVGLVLLAVLPYVEVYQYPFVRYDDGLYVADRTEVQAGLSWAGAKWAFTTVVSGTWQPLTWLSHMLDCTLYGMWAGGHHLTSVALHALNTLLLFVTLIVYTGDRGSRSAFVAAAFAVHPLHVESVAWVAERKDVLSAAFWWTTMLCYYAYVRGRQAQPASALRYGATLVSLTLGLMAKPMLVTLPAVLLLMDYWPLQRIRLRPGRCWRLSLVEKLPMFAVAAAFSILTVVTQRGVAISSLDAVPFGQRVANAVVAYAWYLWKTVVPTGLAVYYPHPRGTTPLPVALGAAALLVGFTVGALCVVRRRPSVTVGWLWFVGSLVPVIGLLQVGTQGMADRYMYIPMTGLLLAIAWAAPTEFWRERSRRTLAAAAAVAALAALGATAFAQVGVWRDSLTLFAHAARVVPRNGMAHYNAAVHLREQGLLKEATRHLESALAIDPRDGASRRVYAQVLTELGDVEGALDALEEGVSGDYADAATRGELGALLLRIGRIDDALRRLSESIELDPALSDARDNLAAALLAAERYAEAERLLQDSVAERPDDPVLWNNLGVSLLGLGRREDAVGCFRRALSLDPDNADARRNLAAFAAPERAQ